MNYKLSRTSLTGFTKQNHSIYFEPDSKTYASGVLLNDDLYHRDSDYLESLEIRMNRIEFSRKTLASWQNQLGSLFCVYCEKKDLQIEYEGMNIGKHDVATMEHLTPVSKGGGIFDLSIQVCACGKCNGNRSDKRIDTVFKSKENYRERIQQPLPNIF